MKAMANFNKVILAGNLTRDPQLSYLPSGTPVCEFGLAINRRRKGADGQMREETCFVDCRAFGAQAENLNRYMAKGRPLLVDGRLRYEQWESKEGQKRSRLSVVVENFQFLGAPGGREAREGGEGEGGERTAPPRRADVPAATAAPPEEEMPPLTDAGDEIPF
jgi:single-strand DNA-binding protein